jgi:hypothetical protein
MVSVAALNSFLESRTAANKQELVIPTSVIDNAPSGFGEGRDLKHKAPSSIALNTDHIKPNSFMHHY